MLLVLVFVGGVIAVVVVVGVIVVVVVVVVVVIVVAVAVDNRRMVRPVPAGNQTDGDSRAGTVSGRRTSRTRFISSFRRNNGRSRSRFNSSSFDCSRF